MANEPNATLTTDQFADLLGVSRWTLYSAAANGTAPLPFIRVGRSIRWSRALVYELLGLGLGPDGDAAHATTTAPAGR